MIRASEEFLFWKGRGFLIFPREDGEIGTGLKLSIASEWENPSWRWQEEGCYEAERGLGQRVAHVLRAVLMPFKATYPVSSSPPVDCPAMLWTGLECLWRLLCWEVGPVWRYGETMIPLGVSTVEGC